VQALPGAEAVQALPEGLLPTDIGQIARKYLTDSYGMAGDKTFGFNNRGGEFFLGNASVYFDGDDLIIDGNKYKGTKGLWGLITMKKTVLGLATEENMRNYEQIMLNSEAIRNRKNPQRPAANKGYKWQNVIRPMWNKYEKKPKKKVKREAKKDSDLLPSGPNALCEDLNC